MGNEVLIKGGQARRGEFRPRLSAGSPPAAESARWIADLEELRDRILRRLDSIEGLVQRAAPPPTGDGSRIEQTLRQRIAELEVEKNRLRSGLTQEEARWRQSLEELESDRQLLVEAWERLERERIEAAVPVSPAATHRPRITDSSVTPPAASPGVPRRPRITDSNIPPPSASRMTESGNPVAEAILRQFQTLCKDVRRATDARCSTR